MSNKLYDILKEFALVWLPALAVFYVAIAGYWDLPHPNEISGTIMAFDALLGAILHISSKQYAREDEDHENEV